MLMDGLGRMVILTNGVYRRRLVTGKERFSSESEGGTLHEHITYRDRRARSAILEIGVCGIIGIGDKRYRI